jgi:GntR family transcriptional regulator
VILSEAGGPFYLQIAATLRKEILGGAIRPGQLLPSETRLAQTYGVSRLTGRAAVNVIRAEGLAELVRGRGVVAREQPEVRDLIPPVGAVVSVRMPTPEERREHDIAAGVPVFVLTAENGRTEIFPGDRWRLPAWPG